MFDEFYHSLNTLSDNLNIYKCYLMLILIVTSGSTLLYYLKKLYNYEYEIQKKAIIATMLTEILSLVF